MMGWVGPRPDEDELLRRKRDEALLRLLESLREALVELRETIEEKGL